LLRSSDPMPREKHIIQPGVKWWTGLNMHKMPVVGETYYVTSVPFAIDRFLRGSLLRLDKKKPQAFQQDYATCLGRPETH
jgi:hypothetical protein